MKIFEVVKPLKIFEKALKKYGSSYGVDYGKF